MTLPVEKRRYTIPEYLAFEEQALDRHEYHDGEILAISGTTYWHSVIAANLVRFLGNRREGSDADRLKAIFEFAFHRPRNTSIPISPSYAAVRSSIRTIPR
jgi:hypothetical protein